MALTKLGSAIDLKENMRNRAQFQSPITSQTPNKITMLDTHLRNSRNQPQTFSINSSSTDQIYFLLVS